MTPTSSAARAETANASTAVRWPSDATAVMPFGPPETLRLDWRRWTAALALTAATLLAMSVLAVAAQHAGLEQRSWTLAQVARRFDVNVEESVPTWFSNLLLCLAGLQLLVIARLRRPQRGGGAGYWTGLGVIFVLLSAEEVMGLHNIPVVSEASARAVSDYLALSWVIHGAVIVGVVALAYLRFLLALPRATMLGFVLAGVCYVGGAIGMEMVGAGVSTRHGDGALLYAVLAIEEGMEMFGVLLLITTLFRYIEREFPRVGLSLLAAAPARRQALTARKPASRSAAASSVSVFLQKAKRTSPRPSARL